MRKRTFFNAPKLEYVEGGFDTFNGEKIFVPNLKEINGWVRLSESDNTVFPAVTTIGRLGLEPWTANNKGSVSAWERMTSKKTKELNPLPSI